MGEKGTETSLTQPQLRLQQLGPVIGELPNDIMTEGGVIYPVERCQGVEGLGGSGGRGRGVTGCVKGVRGRGSGGWGGSVRVEGRNGPGLICL